MFVLFYFTFLLVNKCISIIVLVICLVVYKMFFNLTYEVSLFDSCGIYCESVRWWYLEVESGLLKTLSHFLNIWVKSDVSSHSHSPFTFVHVMTGVKYSQPWGEMFLLFVEDNICLPSSILPWLICLSRPWVYLLLGFAHCLWPLLWYSLSLCGGLGWIFGSHVYTSVSLPKPLWTRFWNLNWAQAQLF